MERKDLFCPSSCTLWAVVSTGIGAISVASILIRTAEAPPLAIAAYRLVLAASIIGLCFVRKSRIKRQKWTPQLGRATALSGLFLALHFIFWISSLKMTSIASSVVLVSTNPLFVALISFLRHGERPGSKLWASIVLTLIGSAIVAGSDFSFSKKALEGDLLALMGALMASGYLMAGRYARSALDLSSYTFFAYGTAALVLLLCCFMGSTPLSGFSQKTYLALVLLALIPQLIGHTAFNWALKFLHPTLVAVLILGEPIGASLLGYIFFSERPGPVNSLGLLILAGGIVLGSLAAPQSVGEQKAR